MLVPADCQQAYCGQLKQLLQDCPKNNVICAKSVTFLQYGQSYDQIMGWEYQIQAVIFHWKRGSSDI